MDANHEECDSGDGHSKAEQIDVSDAHLAAMSAARAFLSRGKEHVGNAEIIDSSHQRKAKANCGKPAEVCTERFGEKRELCEEPSNRRKASERSKAHGNAKRHERAAATCTLEVFEV